MALPELDLGVEACDLDAVTGFAECAAGTVLRGFEGGRAAGDFGLEFGLSCGVPLFVVGFASAEGVGGVSLVTRGTPGWGLECAGTGGDGAGDGDWAAAGEAAAETRATNPTRGIANLLIRVCSTTGCIDALSDKELRRRRGQRRVKQ